MAKQKGGLGRGLSSLLGAEPEAPLVERDDNNTVENQVAPAAEPEKKEELASDAVVPRTPQNAQPVREKAQPNIPTPKVREDASETIYTSKEDNVTIKGVVERRVEQKPAATKEPAKPAAEPQVRSAARDTDEVPLASIEPNPEQPRTNFKKEELEELAESIRRNGLLQPILVRKKGDKYQIIAGERRYQACKKLGLKTVPVRIREVDDDETIMLALIENIQRSDLNPIEEAYAYRRMMDRGRMTQTQVAQAVSKGRSTIANALRLLELPEDAQQLLFEEKITAGHARAILSVPTPEGREKLTDKLLKEQLSVRETEVIARLMSGKKEEKPRQPTAQTPKSYKTVARSLRETLQTDVRVKSVKGKNKIEITFKDEADLERLFRIITTE